MKIAKFLVPSFFLFAFTTASFPSVIHAEESEPVLDVFNQEVHAGFRYFITTPEDPSLVIGEPSKGICPRGVILSNVSYIQPVTFSPSNVSDSPVIRENALVTVKFSINYPCRKRISLVWTVGQDASSKEFLVTLGGAAELDRFKITKYEADGHDNWYRLSYCLLDPYSFCLEIGYVVKDGVKYLAPNAQPFPVGFRPIAPKPRIDDIKMIE